MKTGSKRGRLTASEISEIERLAAEGVKPGRVAAKLDRHPATIKWAFIRLGLVTFEARRSKPYTRGGIVVMPFSEDEDRLVESMRAEGAKTTAIARACSERFGHRRSPHTICMRLTMLANAP